MKRNNRNTLLLIAGITQIIKSFVYCVVMLITSLCFDIIDLTIKRKIYLTQTYAINPELGEKLITLIVIGIFLFLTVAIMLNFASGIIYLQESKSGNASLKNRALIIVMMVLSVIALNTLVSSVLVFVALLVDKQQPESEFSEQLTSAELKARVTEIQNLKKEGSISKQEYIDLLTKLLVK